MASVSKNMTPLRRVRSSFLPRLGNVAGLAQLRPELEILTAKIQKKKLPKCWFLNFHQIITTWTAWIFPGIKKIHDPFMAIYRTNQKVTVSCFFQKSGRQLKKNRNPPKKNMFLDTVPSTLETCWSKSQNAHAHLFGTEAWVKCLGQWDLPWDFGAQGMFGSLFATKKGIPDDIWLRALCMYVIQVWSI